MDSIAKYINFYEIIKRRNGKYPFLICNMDKHNKPGTLVEFYGYSSKKKLLLFDSLGLEGFKALKTTNNCLSDG